MRSYMKSAMPYRGVQAPLLRRILKELFAEHPLASFEEWRDVVLELWRNARYREERYAAIELSGARAYDDYQTFATLPLYEEMIVTGAWWDTVDVLAAHRIGVLLRRYPRQMKPKMRVWIRSPDLWKRRTAILCQLRFGRETDLELLARCIEANLADKEFFIRKAIGWALRELAWQDPETVRRFVQEHEAAMSPLSKREALKNLAGPTRAPGRASSRRP